MCEYDYIRVIKVAKEWIWKRKSIDEVEQRIPELKYDAANEAIEIVCMAHRNGEDMMTKAERIAALESKVASLKSAYESAEWEQEKLKGEGPMIDRLFSMIEASGKTHEEVIGFLSTTD